MKTEDFDRFADIGLIKTSDAPRGEIRNEQKATLNRKGNALFNAGKVEEARRVFLTTGYSDGLIRVGDSYYKGGKPVDALKMYWLAKERKRSAELIEKMALIIQNLLKEEVQNERRPDDGPERACGRPEPGTE
jgi:hypothetical protein